MKQSIYNNVGKLGQDIIVVIAAFNGILLFCACWINGQISNAVAWIFNFVLRRIDSQRYEVEKGFFEQQKTLGELSTLFELDKVKSDCIERGAWTDDHTTAMRQAYASLITEHGWSQNKTDHYFSRLLDDVPGVVFNVDSEEEDYVL